MTIVSKQQAFERWDTLPDNIKEAAWAPQNTALIQSVCANEHIPQDKLPIVLRVSGYVLFGFIHPEDVSKELQEALGINSNIAASVADALDKRIFSSFRTDLDKIFSPPHLVLEEIRRPVPPPGLIIKPEGTKAPTALAETRPSPPISPTALAPKPPSMMPGPQITKPAAPPVPPPVFLRGGESGVKPITPGPGIHVEIPRAAPPPPTGGPAGGSPLGRDIRILVGTPPPPAKVVFGPAPEPPKQTPRTELPAPRIVHYSPLKTPLAPRPGEPGKKEEGPAPVPLAHLGIEEALKKPGGLPPPPAKPFMPAPPSKPVMPPGPTTIDLRGRGVLPAKEEQKTPPALRPAETTHMRPEAPVQINIGFPPPKQEVGPSAMPPVEHLVIVQPAPSVAPAPPSLPPPIVRKPLIVEELPKPPPIKRAPPFHPAPPPPPAPKGPEEMIDLDSL